MATMLTFIALSFITTWEPFMANAKIFIVLMKDAPFVSTKSKNFEDIDTYKENMRKQHDMLLGSLLERSVYTKVYSYTHLINGFAIHLTSAEALDILQNAEGVRAIYEDVKMKKLTTHTPDFLGLRAGVWPKLGGPMASGAGVVIGLIDTGINPFHPSFLSQASNGAGKGTVVKSGKFKGKCVTGDRFPEIACNNKIVGAQYFARAATAAGEFNTSRDYASPFDADGHGSHTASTAAGNHHVPVIVNHFNYGYASGMAPGAGIAVYKAMYSFGGFMSDVVAAVDQAVEDGVDILSLSVGPASVPSGPSAFLNVLEMQLLFATRAGVLVVQAAGNGGPSSTSILSFSPWITSVAASTTDRRYNNSIVLGNEHSFSGSGLSPPTLSGVYFPLAAASDVCKGNTTSALLTVESCQETEPFVRTLVHGKIVICTYTFDFESEAASIATVADTIQKIGAAGFVLTMDPDIGSEQIKGATMTLSVPGLILNNMEASTALREYYNSNTLRSRSGKAISFRATARILDGREASYTRQDPVVASYSSRGPDVNNALLDAADVLKPNIMAPGSSIWASWSPASEGDQYIKGQNFALLSGTSMATPHIAGIAALIKQKHPGWSPAAITSAMMTTADVTGRSSTPILAQQTNQLSPATPFDFGAGLVNPSRAIDPGLVFKASFKHYVLFLCSVPGVDEMSVRRAVGVGCPNKKKAWCSDLNTPSVTISNLVGSRNVIRRVTNVGGVDEKYEVIVQEPLGVSVSVTPKVFKIIANASRHINIVLNATQTTNVYSFGEIVFQGNKKHTVRVPLAVFVSSTLQ
ncbi:subtilisin-like protease SBT2.5 [Lycium ferocissimum]|uniref:subtilisin-like protease SBT2.5 n=1 Tax=Lycium ferocissimum TaxID=112874 RepID=UPI00281509EC|nr:subtilisin-like protease SBT2.5 [Lycium ferocissimum]